MSQSLQKEHRFELSYGWFLCMRALTRAQNFLRSWSKPCLVMFSDKCPVTRGVDKYFEHLIPTAGSGEGQTAPIIIKGAGHF